MPDHSACFEATDGSLVLTSAILLYRTENPYRPSPSGSLLAGGDAFASIHAVEQREDGAPVIAAGTALTRAHLRQWTEALGRAVPPQILPGCVLVAHGDLLAWWTPAQVRPAYFNLSAPPADLNVLHGRTIVPVPYPAHLFVATRRGLGVYALVHNRRPTPETLLHHSPILNVFLEGSLCWGNIPRPRTLAPSAIDEFERAVFDSWSTHPNPGQELTISGKGGLIRLWDALAARKASRFPVARLKPFSGVRLHRDQRSARPPAQPLTFGQLIAQGAQR